jgi:hypothetical protein
MLHRVNRVGGVKSSPLKHWIRSKEGRVQSARPCNNHRVTRLDRQKDVLLRLLFAEEPIAASEDTAQTARFTQCTRVTSILPFFSSSPISAIDMVRPRQSVRAW